MKILLIHGPNLNLLGKREPDKYGNIDSEGICTMLREAYPGHTLAYFQSNHEGELVDAIQKAGTEVEGILINAGAFSHTSVAVADAIRSIAIPCISIHITNIYEREPYRHNDIIGEACKGSIAGLGTDGYKLALECLAEYTNQD